MNNFAKTLIFWGSTLTIFVTTIAIPSTATARVGFQSGQHGADGDPGTDGENGANGMSRTFNPNVNLGLTVIGDMGQNGGNGGRGIDGSDEDQIAFGGNGGDGGRGGDATYDQSLASENSTYFVARGGNGGAGGLGGLGTAMTLDGLGGDGGNGGNAFATTRSSRSNFGSVFGGIGGNASGPGAVAGDGGQVRLNLEYSYGERYNMRMLGGSGGNGDRGADGGNGAIAKFGFGASQFSIAGSERGNSNLWLQLFGGHGGTSINGNGGRGASARINLQHWMEVQAQSNWSDDFASMNTRLVGGSGGRATATGGQAAHGGQAAIALVHVGPNPIQQFETRSWTIDATGGNGGSALGRNNRGDGAHGATAMFSNRLSINSLQNRSGEPAPISVRPYIQLTGGDGGHAQGSGRAGNGASISFVDQLQVNTTSSDFVQVTTTGGDGGWGRYNGHGGDSELRLVDAYGSSVGDGTTLQFNLRANGGDAGQGVAGRNAADGGDASITAYQTTNGRSVTINASSRSGRANFGHAGDAVTDIRAIHTPQSDLEHRIAIVNADGLATGLNSFAPNMRASHGSDAISNSMAVTNSTNTSTRSFARGDARAGWGFLQSGSASADANAQANMGIATAIATARNFGDRDALTNNHSISRATAGSNDTSQATANAHTTGASGHTTAIADAYGFHRAEANLLLTTRTTNWRSASTIETNARFAERTFSDIAATSMARSTFVGSFETPVEARSMSSVVALMPDQEQAGAFVDNHADGLGDLFVDDPNADILGVGVFSAGRDVDTAESNLLVETSVELALQSRSFFNDEDLVLGLFTTESAGDGFAIFDLVISHGERTLLDRGFDSLDQANQFFDDQRFNLGPTPSDLDMIELSFDIGFQFDNAGDRFGFGFVFGNVNDAQPQAINFNAVPEPTSTAFLGLSVVLLAVRRKRQSNNR